MSDFSLLYPLCIIPLCPNNCFTGKAFLVLKDCNDLSTKKGMFLKGRGRDSNNFQGPWNSLVHWTEWFSLELLGSAVWDTSFSIELCASSSSIHKDHCLSGDHICLSESLLFKFNIPFGMRRKKRNVSGDFTKLTPSHFRNGLQGAAYQKRFWKKI